MSAHYLRAIAGGIGPCGHARIAAGSPDPSARHRARPPVIFGPVSSGVDAATAAPPAGDTIIFSAVPQTVDSAYDALTVYLTLDKITFLGLAACCRCSTRAHLVSTPRKSSSLRPSVPPRRCRK